MMSTIGKPERETQSRVIVQFRNKTRALKRGVMQELLMLTSHGNPQHLIDALGPQDTRRIAGDGLGEKLGETRPAVINGL